MGSMPSVNKVWGSYLRSQGFERYNIPDTCPDCYTVKDFTEDHRKGIWVIGTGNHAVAVVDGFYVDDWDSGNEVPIYVWRKIDA